MAEFPKNDNRENISANRDLNQGSREFVRPIRDLDFKDIRCQFQLPDPLIRILVLTCWMGLKPVGPIWIFGLSLLLPLAVSVDGVWA